MGVVCVGDTVVISVVVAVSDGICSSSTAKKMQNAIMKKAKKLKTKDVYFYVW